MITSKGIARNWKNLGSYESALMTQTVHKTTVDRWTTWFYRFKCYFESTNDLWWKYCWWIMDTRSYLSRHDIRKTPPCGQIKRYATRVLKWRNSFMNWSKFYTHLNRYFDRQHHIFSTSLTNTKPNDLRLRWSVIWIFNFFHLTISFVRYI